MKTISKIALSSLLLASIGVGCRAKKDLVASPPEVVSVVEPPSMAFAAQEPLSLPALPASATWSPPMGDSIRQEMRAVWLTTAYGLDWPRTKADDENGLRRQQQDLIRILDRLAADGYNTVFLQVRQSGTVLYPSNMEPFARFFTSSGQPPAYDPLSFAVKACRARGLAIHAWLVTYPLASPKNAPHPLLQRHPAWGLKHKNATHLDPGEPGVRQYIASLARELAAGYDLDGLHFDYFRYPEDAVRFPDQRSYRLYGAGMDREQWRRSNLTRQLEEINQAVHSIKPYMQISVAPLGKLRKLPMLDRSHGWTAFESVYQDPVTWAKKGLVDFLVPMMYYRDHLYTPFLQDWSQSVGRYVPVVAGLAPYRIVQDRWQAQTIIDQMEQERMMGSGGICFFREEHVGDKYPAMRQQIRQFFHRTALPLALPRGLEHRAQAPKLLRLVLEPNGERSVVWMHDRDAHEPPVTYRLWATLIKGNGERRGVLLAQGVREPHYRLRGEQFSGYERVEIGVEAVNSYGVSTPIDQALVITMG